MKTPKLLIVILLFFPLARSQDFSVLRQGNQYIEANKLEEAEDLLSQFVHNNDNHAGGHYLLGIALGGLGKVEESERHLLRALELDERLATGCWRFLGINAFNKGDFDKSEEYLKRLIERAPGDPVGHLFLAQLAFSKEEFVPAVEHFRQSAEMLEGRPQLRLLFGQALMGSDQVEEAKKVLLSIQSLDARVVFSLGVLLENLGLHTEAADCFLKSRPDYPETEVLDYNLALTYFRMDKLEKALPLLEGIVEKRRADAQVHSVLGDVYRGLGRSGKAYSSFQQAVFLAPEDSRNYTNLLAYCIQTGAVDVGLQIAELALKQHSTNYKLHASRGMMRTMKGQFNQAEGDFEKALELSKQIPEDVLQSLSSTEWLYWGYALVLLSTNRAEEARKFLESHEESFATHLSYYLLADVMTRLGLGRPGALQGKVRSLLEKSISLNPNFGLARLGLARIFSGEKEWEKAIVELKVAIDSDPGHVASYYELAQVYLRSGKREEGRQMLAKVQQMNDEEAGRPQANRGVMRAIQEAFKTQ